MLAPFRVFPVPWTSTHSSRFRTQRKDRPKATFVASVYRKKREGKDARAKRSQDRLHRPFFIYKKTLCSSCPWSRLFRSGRATFTTSSVSQLCGLPVRPMGGIMEAARGTALSRVDSIVDGYAGKAGALLGILKDVQALEPRRYLSEEALRRVSERTGTPLSAVYSVATFYSYFNLKPQGEHVVVVCRGTAATPAAPWSSSRRPRASWALTTSARTKTHPSPPRTRASPCERSRASASAPSRPSFPWTARSTHA
jgi:hypothetical protein